MRKDNDMQDIAMKEEMAQFLKRKFRNVKHPTFTSKEFIDKWVIDDYFIDMYEYYSDMNFKAGYEPRYFYGWQTYGETLTTKCKSAIPKVLYVLDGETTEFKNIYSASKLLGKRLREMRQLFFYGKRSSNEFLLPDNHYFFEEGELYYDDGVADTFVKL